MDRPPVPDVPAGCKGVVTVRYLTINEWLAKCIVASFPPEERFEVAQAADAYLVWVESL